MQYPFSEQGWLTDIGGGRMVKEADLAPIRFKRGDRVRQISTGEEGAIVKISPAKGWLTDIGGGLYVKDADLAPVGR